MHSIVNIPHHNSKHVLITSVDQDHAKVTAVNTSSESPYNTCGVCSLYIGNHMFEADKHDALRLMVANAIRFAIEKGREAGYRHAQHDIRYALGIK